jgi:integrase
MGSEPSISMKARWYQKGPNRYQVYLHWQGKPYYRSHYDHRFKLDDEIKARRLADSINQDIDAKGPGFDPRQWFEVKGFNFRIWADQWLREHQLGYAPSVRRDVGRMVASFQVYFGEMDIRSIRAGSIEDYLKTLSRLSIKTQKNYLIQLHKLFSDAYNREDIARIPGFPRLQVPEPETRWLTEEDQNRIFEKIPEHHRPIFWFLRLYACRPAEARALKWDMVHWEKQIIVIKRGFSGIELKEYTKAREIRYLPFIGTIEKTLRGIRAFTGFVFRQPNGRPYGADLGKIWNKACDDAGINRIWLYQGTRHSRATQLAIAGKSLKGIRDLLGHSSQKTADRYEKAAAEGIKKLLE